MPDEGTENTACRRLLGRARQQDQGIARQDLITLRVKVPLRGNLRPHGRSRGTTKKRGRSSIVPRLAECSQAKIILG
jgi:hypothetical protein